MLLCLTVIQGTSYCADEIELAEQTAKDYVLMSTPEILGDHYLEIQLEWTGDPLLEDSHAWTMSVQKLSLPSQQVTYLKVKRNLGMVYANRVSDWAAANVKDCSSTTLKFKDELYSGVEELFRGDKNAHQASICPCWDLYSLPFNMESSLLRESNMTAEERFSKMLKCHAAEKNSKGILSTLWKARAPEAVVCVFIDFKDDLPITLEYRRLPPKADEQQLFASREKLGLVVQNRVSWQKYKDTMVPLRVDGVQYSGVNPAKIATYVLKVKITNDRKALEQNLKSVIELRDIANRRTDEELKQMNPRGKP